MTEPTWKTIGEAIDSIKIRMPIEPKPKPKPESPPKKIYRYRTRDEQIARRHALEAAEARFETEMSERIITESALIRSEWNVQTHIARRVGRPLSVETRKLPGRGRRNGEEM